MIFKCYYLKKRLLFKSYGCFEKHNHTRVTGYYKLRTGLLLIKIQLIQILKFTRLTLCKGRKGKGVSVQLSERELEN